MERIFLFPVIIALFFSSCRKDDPVQPVNGSPVFYATGNFDSSPFSFQAGVNNYYMTSAFSSDVNNVYDFTGELHDQSCSSGCVNDLKVHIRDYRDHSSAPTVIDSALHIGTYGFRMPTSGNTIQFISQSTVDSTATYLWDFDDATTSTLASPTHTYNTAGAYNVTLTISGFLGSSTISDSVFVGSTPAMTADFTYVNLNANDSLEFTAAANGGTGPYNYNWDFSINSNTGSPVIQQFMPDSAYRVTLYVSDAASHFSQKSRNIGIPNYTGVLANFIWQTASSSAPDLSLVTIEWTDAAGNLYTSDNAGQPGSSTFQVLSVSDYSTNENGFRTKKVHMTVDCLLYNGANSIHLNNADLVFAFAYP